MPRPLRVRRADARRRVALPVAVALGLATHPRAAVAQPVADDVYLRPQQRVAVEGRRHLNLFCLGTGSPTVLLDAGAGESMMVWRHVQRALARHTRTCAYDRAGYGFSDAPTRALDAQAAALDVVQLVRRAPLDTPLVYVGHSAAGLYAVRLAATQPALLAGVVLLDPAFAGATARTARPLPASGQAQLKTYYQQTLAFLDRCLALARSGQLARTANAPGGARDAATSADAAACVDARGYRDSLPPRLRAELARQYTLPKLWAAARSEYGSLFPDARGLVADDAQVHAPSGMLGDRPLLILLRDGRHDALPPGRTRAQHIAVETARMDGVRALAGLSTRGRTRIVANTSHHLQFDQPQAVIDAVHEVVMSVRRGR